MVHKNWVRNQGLYDFHYIMKPQTETYWECLHFKKQSLQETILIKNEEGKKEFFSDKISDIRNKPERIFFGN